MKTRLLGAVLAVVAMPVFGLVPASAASAWRTAAKMPNSRFAMTATEGTDGNAYVFGGDPGFGGKPQTMETYSARTGTWTALSSPCQGTASCDYMAGATGPAGKLYGIGGGFFSEGGGFQPFANLKAYSPSTRTWGAKAAMPTARGASSAVAGPDGLIYALGGWTSDPCDGYPVSLTTVETYNPTSNTWATAPSMRTPRATFGAVVTGGALYAIGGEEDGPSTPVSGGCESGTVSLLSSVEAYSFSTHSWTTVAPLPQATRVEGAAVGADGRIYAIGDGASRPVLFIYDVRANVWTIGPTPPLAKPTRFGSSWGPVVAFGPSNSLLLLENAVGNGNLSASAYSLPT